jgi:hypothetical protein
MYSHVIFPAGWLVEKKERFSHFFTKKSNKFGRWGFNVIYSNTCNSPHQKTRTLTFHHVSRRGSFADPSRMREAAIIEEDRWTEVPGLSVTVTKKSQEKVLLAPWRDSNRAPKGISW